MTPEYHQFKLRLPVELMRRVEEEAERSGRSLSAEIVFRLTEAYSPSDPEEGGAVTDIAAKLVAYQKAVDQNARQVQEGMERVQKSMQDLETLRSLLELRLAETNDELDAKKAK
ncbi:hypothetical protein B9Y66_09930 [Stenotrophomonas maltophilia]|nr:hypothetical protein B9Y66_09930 [Stenotrophomonas maltophilia]